MLTSSNRDAKHTRKWTQIGVLLDTFSAVFIKKTLIGKNRYKKATVILSLSECHHWWRNCVALIGAPRILLFFELSMPKSVVLHLPDEFWLSFYFLSTELLPELDPFRCLNR
ncbi:hypothetical protein BTN99_17885 [Vibrio campbellii]|nr:hypothetical protein BTN99_17885 [Vibrio campbellii]